MGSANEPEIGLPTILVEVRRGFVRSLKAGAGIPCPIRVLIKDHDIIQDEWVGKEEEWLLEP